MGSRNLVKCWLKAKMITSSGLLTSEKSSSTHQKSIGYNSTSGEISLLSINARSLQRRIEFIRHFTLSSDFAFILVTESCFSEHAPDDSVTIPGYKPFGNSGIPSVELAALSMSESLYQPRFSGYHTKHHPRCRLSQS